LAQLVPEFFDASVLSVVNGGPDVAAAFCAQPWNHLVFTGSTAVGKEVMKAAAQNLVPVTLELGGKSPVLVGRSADIPMAAQRIAMGKGQNGGQLCVSPDVVWVAQEQLEPFITALQTAYGKLFPAAASNPDVVPVVNARHLGRLQSYVADAKAHGARVELAGANDSDDAGQTKLPLSIVVQPAARSTIAQNEIFGPAIIINTYTEMADAVRAINAGERPLALYYFGSDEAEQAWVLDHTLSGGVAINDVLMHAALHDAPFGGVGASGMGHYHGREGFLEFSHTRSVYLAPGHDPRGEWGLLPPYGPHVEPMMRAAVLP
jgi:coniferyl-aldehyde dehydrogenase